MRSGPFWAEEYPQIRHVDAQDHAGILDEAAVAVIGEAAVASCEARPSTVSSLRPRLRTVSIMPLTWKHAGAHGKKQRLVLPAKLPHLGAKACGGMARQGLVMVKPGGTGRPRAHLGEVGSLAAERWRALPQSDRRFSPPYCNAAITSWRAVKWPDFRQAGFCRCRPISSQKAIAMLTRFQAMPLRKAAW